MKCIIINCDMGNLHSIQHKFRKLNVDAIISSNPEEVETADLLILPGVGHFSEGMKNLNNYELIPVLNKKVLKDKTPILGICLGMQLFSSWSEEGNIAGLGWVDATTKKIKFNNYNQQLKIPHVGWNTIMHNRKNNLFECIRADQEFYFLHSYHVVCNQKEDILSTTEYGINFVSSLQKENIFGTQFHPEKSHIEGMQVIGNFINTFKNK